MTRSAQALVAMGILLLMGAGPGRTGQEEAPADVSRIARVEPRILLPKTVYGHGETIVIELTLMNPSRVPVAVPSECLGSAPLVLRRLSDGTTLKPGRLPGRDPMTLAPLGEWKNEINLTRLYRKMGGEGRFALWWECGEWRSPEHVFVLARPYDPETDKIAIVTTDLGAIEMVLMTQQAPVHVRNFVDLARQGFYDGVVFHEVIPGAQASTGDRRGDGLGGWEHLLSPEIDPTIFPGKGLVGAARRDTSMTNATQFFILLDAMPGWKGMHTFFAYVRKGQEVLDALGAVQVSGGSGVNAFRPVEPVHIRKIEIRSE